MESEEYIFIIIAASTLITSIFSPILLEIKQKAIFIYFKTSTFVYYFFNKIIFNQLIQIIFYILILELLIYFIYSKISKFTKKRQNIKQKNQNDLKKIKNFLNTSLEDLEYKELSKLYSIFKNPNFKSIYFLKFKREIDIRLLEIKNKLIIFDHKRDLKYEKLLIMESKKELEIINREIYFKELKDKEKRLKIIDKLNIESKNVFISKNLTFKEKKILKEEGYVSINEYCVMKNKFISVLVNPPLNHSPTHTFLVWSVKRLLKKFTKIKNIRDYDTREADITFKIKNKTYAIEVERGSLIRKKIQLRNKIEDLEDRYRDRWLILVSNKNLVKKYREFGKVSDRKNLKKNIEKWIKEN